VSVAELGQNLFRELKLLEPCGMGNAVPKLLLQNVWFTEVRNRNIQDYRGQKVRYIKTEFELWDDTTQVGFPGIWWEHYKDEIPIGRCDAIVELDFNPAKSRYEIRLLAVRPIAPERQIAATSSLDWIWDWRTNATCSPSPPPRFPLEPLKVTCCPTSWDDFQFWFRQLKPGQPLALAYSPLPLTPPVEVWQQLVGIAKYLSRTGQPATPMQLQKKLGVGDRSLEVGLSALQSLGFDVQAGNKDQAGDVELFFLWQDTLSSPGTHRTQAGLKLAIEQFLAVVQEEQFRRRYFSEVSLQSIQAMAHQLLSRQFSDRL
jgi:single-stranded-DNA-specific exonuclease